MDTKNHLNKVLPSFNSLNKELSLRFHLVDTFSDHFSFISVNWKDPDTLTSHYNRLNNIHKNSLVNQDTVFVIVDASVKNKAILISYIYRGQKIIAKSVHHAMNVTSMKAKLFTIRYRINNAV